MQPPVPPSRRLNKARRRACCSVCLLVAVLVLWAGTALGQTVSIEHTGSATVKDGKIQLVEGGASTTFRVSLSDDFIADLKTAHPEAARTGATIGAQFFVYRSSSTVTWVTSGTTFVDRTDEYDISHSGTSLVSRYGGANTLFGVSFEERLLSCLPLDSSNTNGGTCNFQHPDSFAAASFPNTFTISAEADTTYFEDESIRIQVAILLTGHGATPSFTSFFVDFSDELTFDLVESALPDPTAKPTAPANLTATAGRGAVTLTWDAIDLAATNTNRLNDAVITKHQYCQKTDTSVCAASDWTDIPDSAPAGVNATSYTVGSLTNGTQYTFQVRAVNACTPGCGNSDPSTSVTATPVTAALAPPAGLTATAGNTEVTLTWTDPNNSDILYYEYQQKAGTAAFSAWTDVPGSTGATTRYRVTGLENGTAYSYRIRSRTSVKPSPASDPVTVTPRGVPPAAPVLTATPRNGGVALSWPDPADDSIQEYEYQYRIGTAVYPPWRHAEPPYLDTSGATWWFPVGGLDNGTPYTFRIRAVNADGETVSNEAAATPVAGVPAKPTGLTVRRLYRGSVSRGYVHTLLWDWVADASILRYQFTTDAGRTWSDLSGSHIDTGSTGTRRWSPLADPDKEYGPDHTFRIRAVNVAGAGPASEPAVEETPAAVTRSHVSNASVEWDTATNKVTLAWDQTRHASLRWWTLAFNTAHNSQAGDWNTDLPIGTTRYEIPATFSAGDDIGVWITACVRPPCLVPSEASPGPELTFTLGAPDAVLTGFSATPGDAQVTLAWDTPADSSITHFEYEVMNLSLEPFRHYDIPDGDDPGTDPGNETSYTVTTFRVDNHQPPRPLVSRTAYEFRLRAVNANGNGPWTEWIRAIPWPAGTPAAPTGVVTLTSGAEAGHGHDHGHGDTPPALTTWDDPHDPSITAYQRCVGSPGGGCDWEDIPGSDATTTATHGGSVVGLRAVNANGRGPSASATIVHSPAPARPAGLRAAPANGRVTLTWDDPGPGVYIEFYRYTADGGETWTTIPGSHTPLQGQFTRYTVPGLDNGRAYTFSIVAENDTGTSPPSATVTATPQAAAPARPTGLVAVPGDGEATLTWDNPHDTSITGYEIKQGSGAWVDIASGDALTTSHTVGTLANGTAYTFQIRAVNDHDSDITDDPGAASDAVTVTPGVPEAPASLLGSTGDTQVTLTWTAPAGNNGSAVTGYEYTSNALAAAPTWTDVPDGSDSGTDRSDETEYAVTGLSNNTVYAFAVRAENARGQGAATPTLRAVPVHADAPRRPAHFRAIPGPREVRLAWTYPHSREYPATAWQYRQSTDGGATWNPDWTTLGERLFTGLANGTVYTFELRGLNGSTAGPSARAQATPSQAAGRQMIDHHSSGRRTAADGSTYTVTQISPPDDLHWHILVPGTTKIRGRAFTLRSLQGTTPYTASRYAFTSSGQEGLDIVVHPPLAGPAQVCLEPSDQLRLEAARRPLRVLRHSGSWTALPTTADGDMLCGTTTGFSAFVLGYSTGSRSRGGGGGAPAAPTSAPPQAVQPLPPQVAAIGVTGAPLDLTPYFSDPDGDVLVYAAVSDDVGVAVVDLPRGSSLLALHGVAAGEAVVTVTASDPHGGSVSQTLTVRTNAAPTVVQPVPAQVVSVGVTSVPLDLAPYFEDPDGDPLTYAAASDNPDVVMAEIPEGGSRLVLTSAASGEAAITVTASDPRGSEVSQTFTVRTNSAPTVVKPVPAQVAAVGGRSELLDLAPFFEDPDGDPLTYASSSDNPGVVTAEVPAGSSQLVLSGVAAGEAAITVTASDPHGSEVNQTFTAKANVGPAVLRPIAEQVVTVGSTGRLDLARHFWGPGGVPLTYTAIALGSGAILAEVPAGSSQLVLSSVAAGVAVVTVTASDPRGSDISLTFTVMTNSAPAVAQPLADQVVTVGGASRLLDLDRYFHDPDGDPLTYAAAAFGSGAVTAEVPAGSSQLVLSGVSAGVAVVTVTASDPHGGEVSQGFAVMTNSAPTVVKAIPEQVVEVGGTSRSLDLAPYFHDPDGDPLTYAAAIFGTGAVTAEVASGSSRLRLNGVAVGAAAIVVTASDPHGGEASLTLTVRSNAAPAVAQPESDSTGAVAAAIPAGGSGPLLSGVSVGEVPIVVAAGGPEGRGISQALNSNSVPVVVQPIADQVLVGGGTSQPLDLAAHFHDPDGDPLTYAAATFGTGAVLAEVPAGSAQLTLRGVAAGEAVIVVTASDPHGAEVSQALRVRTNAAPAVAQPIPEQVVAVGVTRRPLDLAPYFHDPDGDPLTYTAQSDNPGAVTAQVPAGSSQLVLSGVSAGVAVVTVTAGDPHGGEASQALRVRTNGAPAVMQPIPEQVVTMGATSPPLDLAPYFHDPDGDPLTYTAQSDNPGAVTAEVPGGSSRLTLTGVVPGRAVIVVTAGDPHGGAVSQTFAARTNSAPTVAQPIPPQVVAVGATSGPLELTSYFHDPDGDPLTYTAKSDNPGAVTAEVPAGSSRLVLSAVAAGEAAVIVTAIDPYGGEASLTLTVRTNSAPTVAQPIPEQVVAVGGTSELPDLAPYFHDPDGDPLTYAAASDNPAAVMAEVAGGSRLVLSAVAAGEAAITITASDPYGGAVSQALTVRTNSAPTVARPIPPQVIAVGGTSAPLDLAAYFHDPDGDPLTYAAQSDNPGAVMAEVAGGSRLTLSGVAAGQAVVTVTASDPHGGEVSQTLTVRTNSAPTVAQPIPPQVVAVGVTSAPLDLTAYFHDPDGDPLSYTAQSANPEVATAAVAVDLFTLTGVAAGTAMVTVTARDPYDAEASQAVTVSVTAVEPAWVKAWTARFGRTVSGQVLDGVRERLRMTRQAGFEATLAGHRIGGMDEEAAQALADRQPAAAFRRELDALAARIDGHMSDPTGDGASRQAPTGRDLLTSSAFTLTGGSADGGFGTLWGRGVVSHFTGEDGALSLDGEVATGMLGADWVSGRWLTGLTLAMSRGTGGYRAADGGGDVESTLTGLYPWVGYHLTERLSVWAALGYGAGVLTVTPQDQASMAADLTLTLVAAGARNELLKVRQLGGITLALETDARLTQTSTGASAALAATDASVWQLRLGLEGSRHVALGDGGALRPSVEVGVRHDGGDAETGSGIDVGAGLSFTGPASGLSLDLAARGLLTHEASGFQEWGASASLTYDPAPSSDQGLSLSLQQSVGASSSGGVHALLGRDTMAASPGVAGIAGAGRLQARAGYGLPMGAGRFIGTPQLGFGLSDGRHDYTLGWHLSVARREEIDLTLGVEASRRENPGAGNPEHGVMLQLSLGQ